MVKPFSPDVLKEKIDKVLHLGSYEKQQNRVEALEHALVRAREEREALERKINQKDTWTGLAIARLFPSISMSARSFITDRVGCGLI